MTLPYTTHNTAEMSLYVRDKFDVDTCNEVHNRDVYRVRQLAAEGFKPKVIVDIGGHIGTFTSLASKYWPEARIVAFEAQPDNFRLLASNVGANVIAVRSAVLGYYGREHEREILPSHGDEQHWRMAPGMAISFAAVAQIVGRPIDFLKIDCEQSEINILREMDELDAIKDITYIHGEWHLPVSRELIKKLLTVHHTLEIVEGHDQWDMFWAKKKCEL